jgi:membrane fusion protein, multidrug efflux system
MQKYQIAFAALALLLSCSCGNTIKKSPVKHIEIPTVNVVKRAIEIDHLYVSEIQANKNVEIRSKVGGFLESIFVDEGQSVKKGQILFRISDNQYKNEVAKAKALLSITNADKKTAEVELERIKILVDKDIVSKTEQYLATSKVKAAISKVVEAASNLDIAEHNLTYTIIRAPFDGVIDRMPLKTGSLIDAGTLMTTVSDISSMYVYFNISENEYLSYKRALSAKKDPKYQKVCLVLSDGKDYDCEGTIETIVSEFDAATGSIAFRAKFPNPNQLLKHNASGKVRLTSNMEEALLIPQKSVFEIQDKNYVFIVDKDNVVRMRNFIPSGRTKQYYIIKSGLKEGDVIAYEGLQELKDGMTISPINSDVPDPESLSAL